MDQLKEFVLDVWRATGRHTDIATLTTHIAQLLGRWVPVQQVIVRRIEPERWLHRDGRYWYGQLASPVSWRPE